MSTDRRAARRARRIARDLDRLALDLREDYSHIWSQVCEHLGLCHSVQVAAGTTVTTPRLVGVDVNGEHLALIVRLLPGQLPADFSEHAEQIAPALGVPLVRITPRSLGWVRIDLLHTDPLDVPVTTPIHRAPRSVADHPVLIAQDENGAPIAETWTRAPNAVVQGATRSGKSVWCYSVLAQLAGFDDVLIAGSDPSGLLLGRPWEKSRHREWQATGSRDVLAHVALLRRLVDEMDDRIADLPPRVDKLEDFTPDRPLIVVVLEEFAGLLRLASTVPTPAKGEPAAGIKVREQLLTLYGRLVSEGHKAGLRLLVITQRADATVVGGFERGQLGLKLSFRVDDREALPMLHGDEARPMGNTHRYAPPGVALLDTPSVPLRRVRGPRLPGDEEADYARFWDEIAAVTARLHVVAA